MMPSARVNGVNLNYELEGTGEQVVVFLHGFSMGLGMWDRQASSLSGSHRVLRYDLRGQGKSEAPSDSIKYVQSESVTDLLGLLDHLGIDRAVLVGLSNGGNVSVHFALNYPKRLAGLVICDTGAGSDDPDAWRQQTGDWASLIENKGTNAFAVQYLHSSVLDLKPFFEREPDMYERMRTTIAASSPVGLANTLRATVGSRVSLYSLEERLKSLRVPTLIIVGDRDHLCINPSKFLATTIPSAKQVTLENCGHMTNLERTNHFNAALLEFLGRDVVIRGFAEPSKG